MNLTNYRSLRDFQRLNDKIYRRTNDRHYSTEMLVEKLERYCTLMLKPIRKNDLQHLAPHPAITFSWATSIGNRLHIDIEGEMWQQFPGVCPYCGFSQCGCLKLPIRPTGRLKDLKTQVKKPSTLDGFQRMFAGIYYYNTLRDSGSHLAEEAGELGEAVQAFVACHDALVFKNITMELVDVVTNIMAVASCAKLNLAEETRKAFADGCVRCKQTPCVDGFVVIDSIVGSVPIGG